MKILEVINSLKPIGGGETFAVNISRSFDNISELKVVVLRNTASQMFVDRLNEKNIDCVYLDKQKHIDSKVNKQLSEIIKEFKPDAIHSENNALISVYYALKKLPKKQRPPVFHTMHLAPKDECSNRLVKLLYRHIFKKKDFVPIAITESLARESEAFYKRKNIPYVENGVDLDRISNNLLPLKQREYDLVVIGRFSYQKNHEFLIRTLAEVKKRIPTFKAAFIGGGELFEPMKELAKNSGAEFVEFVGVLPNPAVYLEKSKIIALGSRFEANPLSLLEGMGAGCVVVSSNVGGVANIIKKENGFLFKLDDDQTFIDIVCNIINNVESFESMSKFNKEYSKQFSMDHCAKQYVELFEKHLK